MSNVTQTLTFDNGFILNYEPEMDGGGSIQYKDFLTYIKSTGKTYKHCFEWCSGLGAVGFSLLDAGICESITFMDVYEPSIDSVLQNAKDNNVSDKVKAYHLDAIHKLPKDLKFDLVIGNPPHSPGNPQGWEDHWYRIIIDPDWKLHKEFFANISPYVELNSDIILSETHTVREDISDMAEAHGLKFDNLITDLESYRGKDNGQGVLHVYKN